MFTRIARIACYTLTAVGILLLLAGVILDSQPLASGGALQALMFGILSALLHVRRIV